MKNTYLLLLLLLFGMCTRQKEVSCLPEVMNKPTTKKTISLNSDQKGDWTLYFGVQDKDAPVTPAELKSSDFRHIEASVPSNVEIDLLNAGIIKDPMKGDNVYDLRKYETYQWWYQRSFKKPESKDGEKVELCFDGIDCIADIWLNNKKIAHVEDMLVEHHYDVTDLLEKNNQLSVCIYSTVLEARKHLRSNFGVRYDALAEGVSIRKSPHMFGWDIMPRLISAGIWKDVKLEVIPPDYWEAVYWVTKKTDTKNRTADLYVDWQFNTSKLNIDDLLLKISLARGNKIVYQKTVKVYTTVSREHIEGLRDVDFWWPRGYGEPSLYTASLQLTDSTGKILCENIQEIGIRKTELLVTPVNTKEKPGDFAFIVNGERVFVKGTNWVPLDALHSRDLQHLDTAMSMITDLNCNMIRLWGGNVYESDAFYNLCDQNGIMVWQDFIMGCTIYPQNAEFCEKIRKEAVKTILRLRNHACLALWAGNNENDVSLEWGDDQSYIDPNTEIISRQVLPLAIREWDPKAPYLSSSPFISSEAFNTEHKVNSNFSPEMHLWGPRGYYKAPFYTENSAKFVSEIGYHGCPNFESLEKMMDQGFVYPWSNVDSNSGRRTITGDDIANLVWNDQWQCKATCSHPNAETNKQRNHLMTNQIKCVFGEVPTDLKQFITASQIVQAEALKYFIEFWRMNKGERNGIIWWNLRDGWPIVSDAIVDYYGSKKLAYRYVKRVQTDVCVMMGDAKNGKHPVIAVNDSREKISIFITVKDAETGKTVLSKNLNLAENGKSSGGFIRAGNSTKMYLIEWEVKGRKFFNHYLEYNPPIQFDEYMKRIQKTGLILN
jgi:beta-mannosidase